MLLASLVPSRQASANTVTTGESLSCVVRNFAALPLTYMLPTPPLVDLAAEQYRAAISIPQKTESFLAWADQTADFAPTRGTTLLLSFTAAPAVIVLVDTKGRKLEGSISSLRVQQGETKAFFELAGHGVLNPSQGTFTITDPITLAELEGGLYSARGDRLISSSYQLAPAACWWTKNDEILTRQMWDGRLGRWRPIRGCGVRHLGPLSDDLDLDPLPSWLHEGDFLPGSSSSESFAVLRLQVAGGRAIAEPPVDGFGGVLVVADIEAFSFAGTSHAGVVNAAGELRWNPDFVLAKGGTPIWYCPLGLDDTGPVGVFGETLYLAPVPGPLEYPLLRIGSRQWLSARMAANDGDLGMLQLLPGQVGVSSTTGKLRFSDEDLAQQDPLSPNYDPSFLGELVIYDGLAFGRMPTPLRGAQPLLDSNGQPAEVGVTLYLPRANELAPGNSGMLWVPDGTGVPPVGGPSGARPLGTGLRHDVVGPWSLSIFCDEGSIPTTRVVDTMDDVPKYAFRIPRGTAYLVRSNGRVVLSREDTRRFEGQTLYIRQNVVTPSIALPDARLWSRQRYWFTLTGTEKLVFTINGAVLVWNAGANPGGIQTSAGGIFSVLDLAQSLSAVVGAVGEVQAIRGHLVLGPSMTNGGYFGETEIGIGDPNIQDWGDLSGAAALGFLPGWKSGGFVFDHGASLGLFESVDSTAADLNAEVRVEELVLADKVPASPFVLLQQNPLQDVAGYEPTVFFRLQQGRARRLLQPFVDVLYEFEQRRFAFLEQVNTIQVVTQATTTLGLIGQTTRRLLEAQGNGLRISRPGQNLIEATYGRDYRLVTDPGNALMLVHEVGDLVLLSDTGDAQGSTLQDTTQDFALVLPGMQLQVDTSVVHITTVIPGMLGFSPALAQTGRVSYSIFEAPEEGLLLASQFEVFSPLPEEPFRIRILSSLGLIEGPLVATGYVAARALSLRFGLPSESATAALHLLSRRLLGLVGASLSVTQDTHTAAQAYHLEVDGEFYTFEQGNLVVVVAPTPGLTSNLIEVVGATGELALGTEVVTNHAKAQVIYVEDLLPPGALLMGEAELDPKTGMVGVSAEDLAVHAGETLYLVELLRTTGGVDVTLNPIQGSLLITSPLLPRQIVEAEYFQAVSGTGEMQRVDGAPTRVVEFMSLRIRNELATPTGDLSRWRFNPTLRTIHTLEEVAVRVGPIQCNIGNSLKADVSPEENLVFFPVPQDPAAQVMVTYSVLEAFGGEQSFSVSLPPVWRPPFRLAANTSSFTLLGDRTGDILPGKLLRVGGTAFYVVSSAIEEENTLVVIFPPTTLDVGSADPGADSISALTDISVRDQDALWVVVANTFEPASRGATALLFQGDLSWIVVGAVLEIGGYPCIVAEVQAGDTTTVGLTTFLERGFAFGEDLVRVTRRPIYPPTPSLILGPGALDPAAEVAVVRFQQGSVGELLTPSLDYEIEASTGNLQMRSPVPAHTQIYLRHTQLVSLAPEVRDGITQYPRVSLRYGAITIPSLAIQGSSLLATYTFANPDSFLYRTTPLDEFVSEVASTLAASAGLAGGPFVGGTGTRTASQEGLQGPRGELATLRAQDRATRRLIETFQGAILPFEQILETMSGQVIGDRDGKFRFFLGRTEGIAPPGYEDPITGEMVPNLVFGGIFATYRPDIFLLQTDPIVSPNGAALDGETLEGPFPDPELLSAWIGVQKSLIRNDIDDVVLIGRTRKKVRIGPLRMEAYGKYRRMGDAHALSRLFPERTRSFTQLDPGLGADLEAVPPNPGVYAFRKRIDRPSFENGILRIPKRQSTWFTTIAQIENPVLGQIENISALALAPRLPRARIVRYEPFGFPELDVEIAADGGVTFLAMPRPAMIVSLVPLGEFPLDAEGKPDFALLAYQGGPTPDLSTGDPTLFTPPWPTLVPDRVYPKVSLGKPDGSLLDLATVGATNFSFGGGSFSVPQSVFVAEVLLGCLVTFARADGFLASTLLELDGDAVAPANIFPGDSLLVTPPDAKILTNEDDPVTQEQRDVLVQGIPNYRVGFDVGLDEQDGDLRDVTLPSFFDPSLFGIKEILGQRPPLPLTMVEGQVRFRNTNANPTEIPALLGEAFDDSGDIPVPYLSTQSEAQILGVAQKAMDGIVDPDNNEGLALYPDEILGNDGNILATLTGSVQPATLVTAQDFTPVTTAGIYVPHSGVGDVRAFDLLVVEVGQALARGAQGILSVGRVDAHTLETPRFVTPTLLGDRIRYRFLSMMSFVNRPEIIVPPGLVIRRVGNDTQFDLTTISNGLLVWNDGSLLATGGLNNIFDPGGVFAYPGNQNRLRIQVWTAARPGFPPLFIQSIEVDINNGAPTIAGDAGVEALLALPTATHEIMSFSTAAPFVTITPAPGPGQIQEDPSIPGQSIALWFTLDVDTSTAGNPAGVGASLTARIEEDRLTFTESLDLRSVLPRDEPNVDSMEVFSKLEVFFVSGDTSEDVTVNGPAEVNGGQAFTFGQRSFVHPKVGTFTAQGVGSVRVMAWEGNQNTPTVTTNPLVFSALPSSSTDGLGPICRGIALADSNAAQDYRISSVVVGDGEIARVVPGDVVVISQSATGHATTKAGSYLVRHSVAPNLAPTIRALALATETLPPNTGRGFAEVVFPTVTVNGANQTSSFTVSGIPLVEGVSAFPLAGGTLSFVRVLDTLAPTFLTDNYSVDYVAVNLALSIFTVDLGTARDFAGNAIPPTTLDLIEVGTLVTGFDRVAIRFDQATEDSLPRSLVSVDSGVTTALGFVEISVESFAASISYAFGAALVVGPPGVGELGIDAATVVSSASFQAADAVVYEEVPGVIYLEEVDWLTLHGAVLVNALLPGDRLTSTMFQAQAGIFLEPSVPRPVLPLNGTDYRLVDFQSSVAPGVLGFREAAAFGESDPENVSFEVRRIRRFHPVLTTAGEALAPLPALYKMVRAVGGFYGMGMVGLANTPNNFVLDLGYPGALPELQPGDVVRVMEGHTLLASAFIEGVVSPERIWLAAPGLSVDPVGKDLQIWLRQAPVPHEQSWEELLELMTDQVLLERAADLTAQTGGIVETEASPQDPRHLRDTDKALDFIELGIQENDLIIIDPAGPLRGPTGIPGTGMEYGSRPFGDRSVSSRLEPTQLGVVPFLAGGPSELDDNRGFYRIDQVDQDGLRVSSVTSFSDDPGEPPVVFGSEAPYAVLPTISGSQAPFAVPPGGPGAEGQMDLRPTALAGTLGSGSDSFRGNLFSVAPFAYRVIRPNTLFSSETQELILTMRERTLSMIEAYEAFAQGAKYGSYFIFQRDLHARDLGSPTIPSEGKGVMSNAFVDSIRGLTSISPFANTSDAVSILDRRFWIGDARLDRETPAFQPLAPSYATLDSNVLNPNSPVGEGRPVLPDRISEVLDTRDQFRQSRWAWILARTQRETGTLVQIDRAVAQLNKRLAEVRAQVLRRR